MSTYKEMYEKAVKAKEIRQITATYQAWDKIGEIILGRFIGSSGVESSLGGGTYNQYLFDTDEGPVKFALGRAADAEIGAMLKKDRIYWIRYLGQEEISGGRRVNKFICQEVGFYESTLDDMGRQ